MEVPTDLDLLSEEERRDLEARLYSQMYYGEGENDRGVSEFDIKPLAGVDSALCPQGTVEDAPGVVPEEDSFTSDSEVYALPPPPAPTITLASSSEDSGDEDGILVLTKPEKIANSETIKAACRPVKAVESDGSDSAVELDGTSFTKTEEATKSVVKPSTESPSISLSRLAQEYREEVAKSRRKKKKPDPKSGKTGAKRPRLTEDDCDVRVLVRNPFSVLPRETTKRSLPTRLRSSSSSSDSSSDDDDDSLLTPVTGASCIKSFGIHLNIVGGTRNGGKQLLSVQEAVGCEFKLKAPFRLGAPVPHHWTPDMSDYYNRLENYSAAKTVADILSSMSNDPNVWKVDKEDSYRSSGASSVTFSNGRKRRYFDRPKKCLNCCEMGHETKDCSEPKREPSCSMCGQSGHLKPGCSERQCLRCGTRGPPFTPSCSTCRHLDRSNCFQCGAPGHTAFNCPDNWRRFHDVTEGDPLPGGGVATPLAAVVPAVDPHRAVSDVHCCNCAGRGHHLHHCRAYRNSPFPFSVRNVVSYESPDAFGAASGKRQSKRQMRREQKLARKSYRASVPSTPVSRRDGLHSIGAPRVNTIKKFASEPVSPKTPTPSKNSLDLEEDVRRRLEEASEALSGKERYNLTRKVIRAKKKQQKKSELKVVSGDMEGAHPAKKKSKKQKVVQTASQARAEEFVQIRGFKGKQEWRKKKNQKKALINFQGKNNNESNDRQSFKTLDRTGKIKKVKRAHKKSIRNNKAAFRSADIIEI